MNDRIIKMLFEDSTQNLFPRDGDYASLSPEQILKFVNAIVEECDVAKQNVQDRIEYSATPVKAQFFRAGAEAAMKEFKFRLGVNQ